MRSRQIATGFSPCRESSSQCSPAVYPGGIREVTILARHAAASRHLRIFFITGDPGIDRISRGCRGDTTSPEDAGEGSWGSFANPPCELRTSHSARLARPTPLNMAERLPESSDEVRTCFDMNRHVFGSYIHRISGSSPDVWPQAPDVYPLVSHLGRSLVSAEISTQG